MTRQSPERSVLVTGGGRRIGRAIAEALAADGWHVFVHYNRSAAEADDVVARITDAGGTAEAVAADLSDAEAAAGLVPRCAAASGAPRLMAVVNNASMFEPDLPADFTVERWRSHMDTNLLAPALLARALHERIPEGEQGCVVNLLDMKLFALNPDFFTYTLSKAGLHAATVMMAMAFAPRLRVGGVAPGLTLISTRQTPEGFERAHRKTPLGRSSTPEDVVAAVRFILSTAGFTGQVVTVDGGQSLMRLPRDISFLAPETDEG